MRRKKKQRSDGPPRIAAPPSGFDLLPPDLDVDLTPDEEEAYLHDLEAAAELIAAVGEGAKTATGVVRLCAAREDERIVLLCDDDSDEVARNVFRDAIEALGPAADPVVLTLRPRSYAFEDLPGFAVDLLLSADLVIDLTTVSWMYSDSFHRFSTECRESGTRLALVWGGEEDISTYLKCQPKESLIARCKRGLDVLSNARSLRVRSTLGTDFTVELGDPANYPRQFIGGPVDQPGMIGAPLCMSVTAPFVPGTARGTIALTGVVRIQGPEPGPFVPLKPIRITFADGLVTDIAANHDDAIWLKDWFESAEDEAVYRVMDCNLGFDPRDRPESLNNTVVHSYDGGFMIGIGMPYEYRPEGSLKPGHHADLLLTGADVDLDGRAFIRGGKYARDSGVR